MTTQTYSFFPIGTIECSKKEWFITLDKEYKKGLKEIEKFSHIHIYIRVPSVSGKVQLPHKKNPAGVFATLSPERPVPILTKIVRVLEVDHSRGKIKFENSENWGYHVVLDIKPYMPVEDLILNSGGPAELVSSGNPGSGMKNITGVPLTEFTCAPVGRIRKEKASVFLEIFPEYRQEMQGLEACTHIHVLWYFHKFDKPGYRRTLEVNPPYKGPVTGVFACRSPLRPNPLAVTKVKIKRVKLKSGIIEITDIDAFDNSPLLDIKPYIEAIDCILDTRAPQWQAHWPQQKMEVEQPALNEVKLKEADIETILHNYPQNRDNPESQQAEPYVKKNTDDIFITGARQNNLKNIDVVIPKNKLTVITGLSGCGKSSLAFDTLYAEGRRRYMQSLSSSSRQVATVLEKPDFDHMDNMLPAIAIEQKTISRNPRSTVGTISDIYNYLRLLYTKLGTRHCVTCGRAIKAVSAGELAGLIKDLTPASRIKIYPGKKVATEKVLAEFLLESSPDKVKLKNILKEGYQQGDGYLSLAIDDTDIIKVAEKEACPYCENLLFPMHASLFSYNSPEGMCPGCNGLGLKQDIDIEAIVNPEKSLLDGGSVFLGNLRKHREKPNANWLRGGILALAEAMGVDLEQPWKSLPEDFKQKALFGTGEEKYSFIYNSAKTGRSGTITRPVEGMVQMLRRLLGNTRAAKGREQFQHFLVERPCDICSGERLAREGRMVTLGGKRFPQAFGSTIKELAQWLEYLPLSLGQNQAVAKQIFQETKRQLKAMLQLDLHYLSLDRPVTTLSGGEAQRIRLASQMGCGLSGILYILDEPSGGLHSRDQHKIIESMQNLRDLGNTVVVVEHAEETMRAADHIIDLGPGAGVHGGNVMASTSPQKIGAVKGSVTADFLSGRKKVERNASARNGSGVSLYISGARLHNLKDISVKIPLGCITCITGVSGSGKTSLIRDTLVPAVKQKLMGAAEACGPFDSLSGIEYIDKIICIDQSPIGKSPRSNPATYIGLFDEIRALFAQTPEAKKRKYKPNRFSFNDKSGRCPECEGHGRKKIEMIFLPDVWVACKECKGSRYNEQTLEICYQKKNIAQILQMDVEEAFDFFKNHAKIQSYLQILIDVGLSYLKLGQSALSFSGGEAQRIKLASELYKPGTGQTLFILDEPTSGLHPGDIQKLMDVLNKLADYGNSIIIIEHNLDVIRSADWIIDLGPEGGDNGGRIIAEGTGEHIMDVAASYTGQALKHYEKYK